jgi:hypothetical protein
MVRLFTLACMASVATAFVPMDRSLVRTTPVITQLSAAKLLEQNVMQDKYYFPQQKEFPKVLGGLNIGLRKLVVVTGASSGLGLNCAATLSKTGNYFVVMACRDVEKAKRGECDHLL